jgi:integrase/recombinase XerD
MKHVMGISFKQGTEILENLRSHVGDIPLSSVAAWQVLAFLDRSKLSNVTWLLRHRTLRAFFEYWLVRGKLRALPMPPPRQPGSSRTFMPFIYSVSGVRQLLSQAALKRHPRRSNEFSPFTLYSLLLLLYGTGSRINEALSFKRNDVDLKRGTVTFRHTTNRARTIPISLHLGDSLRKYDDSLGPNRAARMNFFVGEGSRAIRPVAITLSFQTLRRKAGITRPDGICRQPRVQDLRRIFAVHCMRAWLKRGKDLRRMLPVLGAYLGHASLTSTEAYLSFMPERFLKHLSRLSPSVAAESKLGCGQRGFRNLARACARPWLLRAAGERPRGGHTGGTKETGRGLRRMSMRARNFGEFGFALRSYCNFAYSDLATLATSSGNVGTQIPPPQCAISSYAFRGFPNYRFSSTITKSMG